MNIAFNTRILSGDTATGKLLVDLFCAVAKQNPSDHFFFITENTLPPATLPSNAEVVVLRQVSNNPLLWKLWYNYKLPALLRKLNAAVLVSVDGVCPARTKVPQCLLVNDLQFLHQPAWYQKKYISFIKTALPASLQKAGIAVTFSEHAKSELIARYKTAAEKVSVVYQGVSQKPKPLQAEKREAVKEKFAKGNEYFLFVGNINAQANLINLLKGFSLFKKRQKSSMQLLIATETGPGQIAFAESTRLYKYRNDINMLVDLDENDLQTITAAAWCSINLSSSFAAVNTLQGSRQLEVPVIAVNDVSVSEILGNTALYTDAGSAAMIAEQMMQVYKDERKRTEMLKLGKEQVTRFSSEKMAKALWENILATARQ